MVAAAFRDLLQCLEATHEALEARCEELEHKNARLLAAARDKVAGATLWSGRRLMAEPQHLALPPRLEATHEALEARGQELEDTSAWLGAAAHDQASGATLWAGKRLMAEPQHRAPPPHRLESPAFVRTASKLSEVRASSKPDEPQPLGSHLGSACDAPDCSVDVFPAVMVATREPEVFPITQKEHQTEAVLPLNRWAGRGQSSSAVGEATASRPPPRTLSSDVLMNVRRAGVFQVRKVWEGGLLLEKILDREQRTRVEEDLRVHLREAMQEPTWVDQTPIFTRQIGGVAKVRDEALGCSRVSNIVLHPRGLPRLLWDCLCVLLVLYDFTLAPLQFMWVRPPHFLQNLDIAVNIGWSIDIALSFRTGFYLRGKLVMDPRVLATNYLRTWLIFDLIIVLAEWLELTSRFTMQVDEQRRVIQVIRMARLIRLVRVSKLPRLRRDLLGSASSVPVFVMVHVAVWVLGILAATHVIACIWYALGDQDGGWAQAFDIRRRDLVVRYFISLQWAISQVHGTTDIHPVTTAERVFACVVEPFFVVIIVLFVSTTTQVLGIHSYYGSEHHERAVSSYLQRHHVRVSTAINIQHVVREQSRLRLQREKYNEVLKLLPVDLFKELMQQVRGPALTTRHRFFRYFRENFPRAFRQICHEAIREEFAHDDDIVFEVGDACSGVRCVADGQLRYELDPDHGQGDFSQLGDHRIFGTAHAVKVTRGFWISEAALWMPWKHVGKLWVLKDAFSLVLPLEKLLDVVSQYQEAHYTLCLYARQFTEYINEVGPNDVVDNLPVSLWDPQLDGTPMTMDAPSIKSVPLPFQAELPDHISATVVRACVRMAQRIAAKGLDENRPHHGFTIIIGDAMELEKCGKAGFNPFKGHDLRVVDASGLLDEDVFDTLRRNAFNADGAIVVAGLTGQVIAAGWFVADISLGGTQGGARARSARAVAQQAGGCYVIKCSEDSTKEVVLCFRTGRIVFNGVLQDEQTQDVPGPLPQVLALDNQQRPRAQRPWLSTYQLRTL